MPSGYSKQIGKVALTTASGLFVFLLVLPLVALIVRALQNRAWESTMGSGVLPAIALSLTTTGITALVTVTLGTPLAFVLARWKFPFKRVITVLIELPIVMPPAVAGLALLVAFGGRGLLGPLLDSLGVRLPFTSAAVVFAQLFISAPFYVRSAQVGFQTVEREIEDAARVDGAGGLQLFRRITLPLAGRALAAGLTLSWARALGEFGATILFAGSIEGRTRTLPLLVYQLFEQDINAAIWAGLLLIGMALGALLLSQWLRRNQPTD